MTDKPATRRQLRDRARLIDPDRRARAGDLVLEQVTALPEWRAAGVVLLYAALPDEVPTGGLASRARAQGKTVAYPRCLPETRAMTVHRVERPEELLAGSHGLSEPSAECPLVSLEEVALALVPGLGFDRTGMRIGRGAGYYDRLLGRPEWRGTTCGIFFAGQELGGLPADPWDRPLNLIVTEVEVIRPPTTNAATSVSGGG